MEKNHLRNAGQPFVHQFQVNTQRNDPGKDGGGIYRNIARENRIPNILSKGEYATLTWYDICKLLQPISSEDLVQVNLVDTVILDRGDVVNYIYTNVAGYIAEKPARSRNLPIIRDEFCQYADKLQPKGFKYVAVTTSEGDLVNPIELEAFNSICMGSTPLDLQLIQCYIPSKGDSLKWRTYRTDYWLDRNAKSLVKTVRRDISQDISGSKDKDNMSNMSRRTNKIAESFTYAIVSRIQQQKQCKVIHLTLDFVEDASNKLWLTNTSECTYAIEKVKTLRTWSSQELKANRASALKSSTQSLDDSSIDKSEPLSLGHSKYNKQSFGNVDSVGWLNAMDDDENTLSVSSKSRNILVPSPLRLPNSRLTGTSFNPALFGSSQLEGCKGDFCNFDLALLESISTTDDEGNEIKKSSKLSDFRRRMLSEIPSVANANLSTDESKDERPPSIEAKDTPTTHRIPFHNIIQARQEMPLVNRLLRKIKNGQRSNFCYATEQDYSDLNLSSKMPSHVYQLVDCCETCFRIYKIIQTARTTAVHSIGKKPNYKKSALSSNYDDTIANSNNIEESDLQKQASLDEAMRVIESVSKLDVAEIRALSKPPVAVEIVMEAVLGVLTGKIMNYSDIRRIMGGGEAFLLMLREFSLGNVTLERLALIAPYIDNPLFRPEIVATVSTCAAKFCAWVLGVIQAARWNHGIGHKRIDLLSNSQTATDKKDQDKNGSTDEQTFLQKLERKRRTKLREPLPENNPTSSSMSSLNLAKAKPSIMLPELSASVTDIRQTRSTNNAVSRVSRENIVPPNKNKNESEREKIAVLASQKRSNERLASLNKADAGPSGAVKQFRCFDGITCMPYIVLGNLKLGVASCNFIVIHDFFDTCDSTAIAMKPIVLRHDGCQILCFNYPGQANTVWPRPSAVEKQRGAKEPPLNNDWLSDRIHELLQHAEESGDMLLTSPFHIVGFGNGASIAAAFALKYGANSLYKNSLRSIIDVNGFLHPDPQLTSILHTASQVFENTPHSRPDIPISFWTRFVFSEEYLRKVNPNLALNLYTAVSNPITNDGRVKISKGCLLHKDLRGLLNPLASFKEHEEYTGWSSLQIPVIIVQSTENSLVNASNVDSFLVGRTAKHLWSHQLNYIKPSLLASANEVNACWVGKLSNSSADYCKFSILGKQGLKMLLETLKNPHGAFVMWVRAGHAMMQENKSALLDLFDALCNPSEDYYGLSLQQDAQTKVDIVKKAEKPIDITLKLTTAEKNIALEDDYSDSDILFQLEDSKSRPIEDEKTVHSFSLSPPKEQFIDKEVDLHNVPDEVSSQATETIDETILPVEKVIVDDIKVDNDEEKVATENQHVKEKRPDIVASPPAEPKNQQSVLQSLEERIRALKESPYLPASISPQHEVPIQSKPAAVDSPTSIRLDLFGTEFKDKEELKKEIDKQLQEFNTEQSEREIAKEAAKLSSLQAIEEQQSQRMDQYKAEDANLLKQLELEKSMRQQERDQSEKQRLLEIQKIEEKLLSKGLVAKYVPPEGKPEPVREIPSLHYSVPKELPSVFTESKEVVAGLDRMIADEEAAKRRGIMSMEEYELIKAKMAVNQISKDQTIRHMDRVERERFMDGCVRLMQRVGRGYNGRKKAAMMRRDRELKKKIARGVILFQAVVRGTFGRKRAANIKRIYQLNVMRGESVETIQRVWRGYQARKLYFKMRRRAAAISIQKSYRGHVGRLAAWRERNRLNILRRKIRAASKIQATWRMKVAKEEFRSVRIHMLAAVEIQRRYRGYLGRKMQARRKAWQSAAPGPERIKLGLKMIEESKVAFERQQEEIDALHRAQERAEARVSHIHAELKESEKELVILERELQEIDQIERDLQNMTHERDILLSGIRDAAGMPRTSLPGHEDTVMGKEPSIAAEDSEVVRRKKAEAYALELTIQIKRAEREKKRQELETEFASVFQEVEKKKQALERLESSLADMESTRERKDREFRRLQKNLMQLLLEQKQELDDLRQKGIELETATATTAAAATITAQKAKEHEKRSTAMFSQTEELMKFQFMSMSLSYFSSLNMLKQLRDMNADTTSAAIVSSADAAMAAAAAATASNLPNIKKLNLGADDFVSLNIQKKRNELAKSEKAQKDVTQLQLNPLPNNVQMWSVDDVCRWLETLSLGQYCNSFREATIDGPFLMELREEDLIQVLGMTHKLHVRKVIISREKLKPLSQTELMQKEMVEHEEKADRKRNMLGVPDLDTVFSQARNGRLKRLEESLNLGFPIDSEDPKGNTLLLIAAQNSNKRLVEMLVTRGTNVNHQNAQGNTALHFAMAFDKEGTLAEYLIENGADDTIENLDGLTCYDGVK